MVSSRGASTVLRFGAHDPGCTGVYEARGFEFKVWGLGFRVVLFRFRLN